MAYMSIYNDAIALFWWKPIEMFVSSPFRNKSERDNCEDCNEFYMEYLARKTTIEKEALNIC